MRHCQSSAPGALGPQVKGKINDDPRHIVHSSSPSGLSKIVKTSSSHPLSERLRAVKTRSLSFNLLCVLRRERQRREIRLGVLLEQLGDRSFGWAILLSSLINLLPLPPGATLVTAIPPVFFSVQLVLGRSYIWLPTWVAKRTLSRSGLRRTVLRLRPISRRLERLTRPRLQSVFEPKVEKLVGLVLLCIALALFVPLPLSGWFPAISLFITGIGFIERDGLVVVAGLGMGLASIVLTVLVALSVAVGAETILH